MAQVVDGADVAGGAAAGAHEDGVRDRLLAGQTHARQEWAVADPRRAEQGALALHQIVHTAAPARRTSATNSACRGRFSITTTTAWTRLPRASATRRRTVSSGSSIRSGSRPSANARTTSGP